MLTALQDITMASIFVFTVLFQGTQETFAPLNFIQAHTKDMDPRTFQKV